MVPARPVAEKSQYGSLFETKTATQATASRCRDSVLINDLSFNQLVPRKHHGAVASFAGSLLSGQKL